MMDQGEEHSDAYARQSAANSAAGVASAQLHTAQSHLKTIRSQLEKLERQWKVVFDTARGPAREIPIQLRALEADTGESRTTVTVLLELTNTALNAVQKNLDDLQKALERPLFSPPPAVAAQAATAAAAPATTLSMAMTTLDERERSRMASIRTSLQLSSDEEVLESCVAVQNYFTARVAEGWRIFLERKRERREVILQSIGRE